MRGRIAILGLVVALAMAPGFAAASQNDARLDPLFERLKSTQNPTEARAIEVVIWQIWNRADDPAADALMRLGLDAMDKGDLRGAFALFDAVTVQNPEFAEGWNKRATVLYLLGAIDESARDVAKTLALEPRHFGALSGLGLINLSRGQDGEALRAFEQALRLNPFMPGVRANVDALRKRGRGGAI